MYLKEKRKQPPPEPVADPDTFFDKWAFQVPRVYWDLFGLKKAEVIDQVKNDPLRRAYIHKQFISTIEQRKQQIATSIDLGSCIEQATIDVFKKDKSRFSKEATQLFKLKKTVWKKYGFNFQGVLDGYVFFLKDNSVKIQIIKNKGDVIIFADFDFKTNSYSNLRTIKIGNFELFLKTNDTSLAEFYDPNLLNESEFKYLLKSSIKKAVS